MSGWIWVLIVAVVVVLVAALLMGRNRSARLQQRFGPEYERAVGQADHRRAAEAQLRDRARRRSRLDVVPLPEPARLAYLERWRTVQEEFVDNPGEAVSTAELLLNRVMAERGYPVADFEEQADLVSVDHPDVVENYRGAHAVNERNRRNEASTEELREALLRYRSLFEDLLRPEDGSGEPEAGAPATAAARVRDGRSPEREEQR